MQKLDYLEHLSADGSAALAVGRRAPRAEVPSCPGWTVEDVIAHLGQVHRWVEKMVRTKAETREAFPERPPAELLPEWFADGLDMLLGTLGHVDPEDQVWNWMALAPAPARFWPRRMAHETAVHRWDAENAAGEPRPVDPVLALDGIDEYVEIVNFCLRMEEDNPHLTGTVGLEATDAPFACTLTLSPTELHRADGLRDPEATVRAVASDLLLWMCGRRAIGDATISLEGDPSVARRWSTISFE